MLPIQAASRSSLLQIPLNVNVLYEEEGSLKVGAVLADNAASLQVEAPHGKRSKIKGANVLLRFDDSALGDFLPQAQQVADTLDVDFLWECSAGEEFAYDVLAREYFGRAPTPTESAGVLMKLHGAPMYFYKRGKGRYKAAPEDALKAALASVERKKQQAVQKDAYLQQLTRGQLPVEFAAIRQHLLFRPDRNSIEWKALEEASAAMHLTPARVMDRCGGIPSTHDYHLEHFLFEHFPHGAQAHDAAVPEVAGSSLPLADVRAFSIDDVTTTEIDDAFSFTPLADGAVRVGIHIAAPALAVPAESELDATARERLSTVYFPGGKITMMPRELIERYTLAAGRECPALSLYVELDAQDEVRSVDTRVERVHIADNLRHDALARVFNEQSVAAASIDHEHAEALSRLWHWAGKLERTRRGDVPENEGRPEYTFSVENDRVQIVRRWRGTPIDKLVAELMIFANSTWGKSLADAQIGAIYRVQGGGKVRMSTVPGAHVGLGVANYAWSSSPLRRYVDLVNQRQLVAHARGEPPVYPAGDERLPAIIREFESAYDIYGEFQSSMER